MISKWFSYEILMMLMLSPIFLMCLNDFDDVHMSFQRLFYDCDDFLKIFRWFHMIWWFRWFPNDLHVILLWYWCSLHCLMCFKWFWWFPNDVLEKIEVILMIFKRFLMILMISKWFSYEILMISTQIVPALASCHVPLSNQRPTTTNLL